MSWVIVEHEGKRHRLAVVRGEQGVWVGWPGGAKLLGGSGPVVSTGRPPDKEIRAPMTARVVKIQTAPGAEVKVGDIVVVLEAMKMEYRLAAPRKGIVASLRCKEGDQVDLGAILVVLS